MSSGKSKSNTGIGLIDQTVDAGVNATNQVGQNIEKSGQRIAQGLGEISRGNFNNAGNTLLETTAAGLTGGVSVLAGYKPGETPTERRTREALAKIYTEEQQQIAAEASAAATKKQSDINTMVSELVNTRRRQPGKAATLLTTIGAASSYGPLLTGKE